MPEPAPPTDAAAAAKSAKGHFRALTGYEDCSVTGVRPRQEGGWSVLLDVVELARIPASTSVIATYRVDVDGVGGLSGYERLRRYLKGATDG
ncbi:gas vesicle protein GvpO [Kutzneria buriramensis]|uniref:Gas vesicle protein GvpO n=1 Tax=Kutzneria buriramensis TaxID=1045776 RepID=A0A3E0HIW7_9PSEU|nr:gas vesicle protein GvpO [Kutzneria buriramensis]REH46005.1 gas vesicle protein GvpO [Kutzneria buriramensis]